MTTNPPTPPPPLDIVAYHVNEFALRALEEYAVDRRRAGNFDVDFEITRNENSARDFRIIMDVDFAESGYTPDENPPYSISLTIAGYFSFAESVPEDQMLRMIKVNGASILYGIARGFVGQATGASKNGQFVLPAVNFIELVNAREKEEAAALAATATPPKELPPATETAGQ